MDFHPMRDLSISGIISIFEGIITIKDISLPHTVLAITSFLFQTPHASPTFVFTSLPILIYLAESQPVGQFILNSIIPLIGILTAGGLSTSWNLIQSKGQVITGQTALSACIGIFCGVGVLLHRLTVEWGGMKEGSWDTTLVFGLIWVGIWLVFSWLSPFGRYGIPTPFPSDIPVLALVNRHLGPTGIDVVCGLAAYAAYYTGQALWDHRDTINFGSAQPGEDPPSTPPRRTAHVSSLNSSRSSRSTFDTEETLSVGDPSSSYNTGGTHQSTPPTSASPPSKPRRTPFKKSIIGLAALGIGLSSLSSPVLPWSEPNLPSTSDSINFQTPFGLGFVLPPGKDSWRLKELIYEARVIGNRANLLVFPESAYTAYDKWDRQMAIDTMVREVCQQYGVWVQLGIETTVEDYEENSGIPGRVWVREMNLRREIRKTAVEDYRESKGIAGRVLFREMNVRREVKKINEVVFMGPEGEIGSYVKQKLIPYVESFPFVQGSSPIPTWNINLPPPPGTNKTDWTINAPYTRPIHISPLICLEIFHPDLLSFDETPDLFTLSAAALTTKIAEDIIGQAESIAISHSAPVMVVSGSRGRMDQGISALLDGWGRPLMQQRGGRSIIYQVSIPYRKEGEKRGGHYQLGSISVLGAGIAIIGISRLRRKIVREARSDTFPMRVFRYITGRTDEEEGRIVISPSPNSPPPYRTNNPGTGTRRSDNMGRAPWQQVRVEDAVDEE